MTVIDSLEFAQTGQSLHGSLPVPELVRLRDSLADVLGEIGFVVKGGLDARRRPHLSIDVSGMLHLQCQRCLGVLDYPVSISNTLLLASPGSAAAESFEAQDAEWIEASTTLDVAGLIEDEVLLSLPYSPRHAEGTCRQGRDAAPGDAKATAFAKLAVLKRNGN
ncbi:MAG TPA: YceD family protein [Burkholderiales bacterium]|nr:YceD family protein [Burkholderiales bacterium]